jgi:hypothetical protein
MNYFVKIKISIKMEGTQLVRRGISLFLTILSSSQKREREMKSQKTITFVSAFTTIRVNYSFTAATLTDRKSTLKII